VSLTADQRTLGSAAMGPFPAHSVSRDGRGRGRTGRRDALGVLGL